MRRILTLIAAGAVLVLGACASDDAEPADERPSVTQGTAAPGADETATTESPGDAPPSDEGAEGTFTMAEVETHNTTGSCWTVIDGLVYDLTDWVSQHPGGAANIAKLCGKDGSDMFNDQHSGDDEPHEERSQFVIGELAD